MWQPYVPTHVVDLHYGNQWYIQNLKKCSYIYVPRKGKLFAQSRRQVCSAHLFLGGACPAVHMRENEARGQMLTTTFSLQFHLLLFPFFYFISILFVILYGPQHELTLYCRIFHSFVFLSFFSFNKNDIFTVCNYIAIFQPFY